MTVLLLALLQTAVAPAHPHAASVYHVSWKVDVPVTAVAGAALVIPYLFADQLIRPRCPCDPREVNAFDRPAIGNKSPLGKTLSDVTVITAMTLPLALDALAARSRHVWFEDAVVFGQVLAVNSALVTVTKFIVQRPLPRTYAGDPSLIDRPEGYRSFYSGHTSTAFAVLSAAAMTMRLRYGERTWPWVVTGVVGASVAVERVADGRHFPSDVIVAALAGTATGIVVPWLHARAGPRVLGPTISPVPSGLALGMTYQW